MDTEDGKPYRSIFEAIRLQHVINDIASARILDSDKIIPEGSHKCGHISSEIVFESSV